MILTLSISLAIAGTAGSTILVTQSYALAEPLKIASAQTTNATKAEKFTIDSMLSTYTTPVSIILSAIGGVVTYSINESWKRRQYLEEKIKNFEDKKEVVNVRKMLSAELQCIELFPFLEKPTYRFIVVEDCLWAEALLECKCNKTLKDQYEQIDKDNEHFYLQKSAIKACIRDNFNRYLDYLQQFEKMVEAGVIGKKILETYLEPWLELIDRVNDSIKVKCPSSGTSYLPKVALLEYMGLLEDTPEQNLSIVQKDVRRLVSRFRSLSSFTDQNKLAD